MYRPQRPAQQHHHPPQIQRLPKLLVLPTVTDLQFAADEAKKRKVIIELPWGPGSHSAFVIVVNSSGEGNVWSLFEGDNTQADPLWRHASNDTALIHSLIYQMAPDDMLQAPAQAAPTADGRATLTGMTSVSSLGDASKASLQGRLENMQIATLVQSIQMSKMNGRLQLHDKGEIAQIFFNEGNPVHATTPEANGDSAVVEVMAWETGDFLFFPDEMTAEKSVRRRLDGMIMEGITLLDQQKFLTKQGVKPESYLLRKEARISPDEFKSRVSRGAPLDLQTQMTLYEMCDGRMRLQDILQRRPMTKIEWVPLVFNLLSCGLITIADVSPFASKAQGLAATEFDRGMIAGVLKSLTRGDTGMFTYPALLFFLEREFAKSCAFGMPLTLIVFEARIVMAEGPQTLPIQAMKEIAARAETMKRPFDILAHYETFDFAVMLPGANTKTARMFAQRFADSLINVPLIQGQTQRLLLAGGIASIPEDTQELGRLMSAAREAKTKAKEARAPLKAFSEL
ncbi:MAG: DUF4388 domain-containing protein [Candidatus Obscuribacterales bacterium]|nr:DUF4388 domain-containing protein [Candidatus Obscuribacterales bacterium]